MIQINEIIIDDFAYEIQKNSLVSFLRMFENTQNDESW